MEHSNSEPPVDMCTCIAELLTTIVFPSIGPVGNLTLEDSDEKFKGKDGFFFTYLCRQRPFLWLNFSSIAVQVADYFCMIRVRTPSTNLLVELLIPPNIVEIWPEKEAFRERLLSAWHWDLDRYSQLLKGVVVPLPGMHEMIGGARSTGEFAVLTTWKDCSQWPQKPKRGKCLESLLMEARAVGLGGGGAKMSERTKSRRKRLLKLTGLPGSEGAVTQQELLQKFKRKRV